MGDGGEWGGRREEEMRGAEVKMERKGERDRSGVGEKRRHVGKAERGMEHSCRIV